ncbi:phage tail protein I [Desulfocurvus sp. DL9XJH121]
MADLLPPNASAAERALAEALARLSEVPAPLARLWDPETCPDALLPWLAWAMSVDQWEPDWTEAQRREVVRRAVAVHKVKGTRGALQRSLNALGYTVGIREWWQENPSGEPFTFSLEIEIDDRGIDEDLYAQLRATARAAKNVRSHLAGLVAVSRVPGTWSVGCGALTGSDLYVEPWQPGEVPGGDTSLRCGAAFVQYQLVTVNPLGG